MEWGELTGVKERAKVVRRPTGELGLASVLRSVEEGDKVGEGKSDARALL